MCAGSEMYSSGLWGVLDPTQSLGIQNFPATSGTEHTSAGCRFERDGADL